MKRRFTIFLASISFLSLLPVTPASAAIGGSSSRSGDLLMFGQGTNSGWGAGMSAWAEAKSSGDYGVVFGGSGVGAAQSAANVYDSGIRYTYQEWAPWHVSFGFNITSVTATADYSYYSMTPYLKPYAASSVYAYAYAYLYRERANCQWGYGGYQCTYTYIHDTGNSVYLTGPVMACAPSSPYCSSRESSANLSGTIYLNDCTYCLDRVVGIYYRMGYVVNASSRGSGQSRVSVTGSATFY